MDTNLYQQTVHLLMDTKDILSDYNAIVAIKYSEQIEDEINSNLKTILVNYKKLKRLAGDIPSFKVRVNQIKHDYMILKSELKLHQDNNQNMRELLLKNNFDFTEYQNSLQDTSQESNGLLEFRDMEQIVDVLNESQNGLSGIFNQLKLIYTTMIYNTSMSKINKSMLYGGIMVIIIFVIIIIMYLI